MAIASCKMTTVTVDNQLECMLYHESFIKCVDPKFSSFLCQIALADVPGTGKEGRILKEDIMHYLEEMKTKTTSGTFYYQLCFPSQQRAT